MVAAEATAFLNGGGASVEQWFRTRKIRDDCRDRSTRCTHTSAITSGLKVLKSESRLLTARIGRCEVMPSVDHHQQKRLNNRAENSHQPTRERERRMRGFKSAGHAQRFLSSFGVIASFFRPGRHLLAAQNYREIMRRRFAQWRELAGLQPAI
jgi:hypothetical protein